MSPEIERLIHLQDIETRAAAARRRAAEGPAEIAALDAKLTAANAALDAARQALADTQTTRRTIEKDLTSAQQRLAKYKEQLMAVKTNDEYHAMQHQIATSTADVEREEERMLVNMMAADERTAAVKAAEAALKAEEKAVAAERAGIEQAVREAADVVTACAAERAEVVAGVSPATLGTFERVLQGRQGRAMAQALDERCVECHVRLRPVVYYEVRKNQSVVQCDSCQRILYYVPQTPDEARFT
ncbi:MAG: zinc ribbon domain-containing protein [Vicinamibacterales bacterium]